MIRIQPGRTEAAEQGQGNESAPLIVADPLVHRTFPRSASLPHLERRGQNCRYRHMIGPSTFGRVLRYQEPKQSSSHGHVVMRPTAGGLISRVVELPCASTDLGPFCLGGNDWLGPAKIDVARDLA